MTNKDQNTYISTYMKHRNIFQNRLKSYSEKVLFVITFFSKISEYYDIFVGKSQFIINYTRNLSTWSIQK